MPTEDEIAALRLFTGTPVHRLLRTTFDQHDQPIEVDVVILPGDRHVLLYDVSADWASQYGLLGEPSRTPGSRPGRVPRGDVAQVLDEAGGGQGRRSCATSISMPPGRYSCGPGAPILPAMVSPNLSRRVDSHDEDLRVISDTVIEIRDEVVEIKTKLTEHDTKLDGMRTDVAGVGIGLARILAHFGIPGVTAEDIDRA